MKNDPAEKRNLSILHVNTKNLGGGADQVTWSLHQSIMARGEKSWIYVGSKRHQNPRVFQGDNNAFRSRWARIWIRFGKPFSSLAKASPGVWRLHEFLTLGIGQPSRWLRILSGYEDYCFPATGHLLEFFPEKPDLIHCHNLHGGYFDLRALPWLSRQCPLVITLHDAWLLTGHCAHSLGCKRWETGCRACPDLNIYPPIRRDATAYNWRVKRDIFRRSRLYVAAPCRWLMHKVEKSILIKAILEAKVIPHGVDLSIFKPAEKLKARKMLNLPVDSKVVLFSASSIRGNFWRDSRTMKDSICKIAASFPSENLSFFALGEKSPETWLGRTRIQFIPFQENPLSVARYYQASDVYVHPATEDTFPNAVIEALACGTPVVATSVGGIPEQVVDGTTGFLFKPRDSEAAADAIKLLLTNRTLHMHCSDHAAEDARKRFDARRMVDDYLHWYREILESSEPLRRETHAAD